MSLCDKSKALTRVEYCYDSDVDRLKSLADLFVPVFFQTFAGNFAVCRNFGSKLRNAVFLQHPGKLHQTKRMFHVINSIQEPRQLPKLSSNCNDSLTEKSKKLNSTKVPCSNSTSPPQFLIFFHSHHSPSSPSLSPGFEALSELILWESGDQTPAFWRTCKLRLRGGFQSRRSFHP